MNKIAREHACRPTNQPIEIEMPFGTKILGVSSFKNDHLFICWECDPERPGVQQRFWFRISGIEMTEFEGSSVENVTCIGHGMAMWPDGMPHMTYVYTDLKRLEDFAIPMTTHEFDDLELNNV